MAKLPSKNKHILRIVLLSIASIPVLVILYIVIASLLSPVFDNMDKAKFEKLDTESRALYEQIKSVSGGSEAWTYKASCEEQKTGDWPTGEFFCTTLLSTEVNITSVAQLNSLHDKYYFVIDRASMLIQKTELDKQYPNDFGLKFVVSSAEKHYTNTVGGDIDCTYLAKLGQSDENADVLYGTDIANGAGVVRISLDCTSKARGDWYNT